MGENEAAPVELLSNLEHLDLMSIPECGRILKGLTRNVSLRSLMVVSIRKCNGLKSIFSSSLVSSLMQLEKLCVSYCNGLETVFMDDEAGDIDQSNMLCLPNLKTLEIIECPGLKYVLPLSSAAHALPRLQKLRLCCLKNLSSFDSAGNYLITAPALEKIQLTRCPRLSNLTFQTKELVMDGQLLRERSQNFEEVLFDQLQDGEQHNQYPMSRLETMVLDGLIWLRYLWKGPFQVVVTNLKELRVSDCNRLTYIFPIMLVRNLPKLNILEIWWCKNLEQIIVNNDTSTASSSSSSSQDETKEILKFPQLKELYLGCLPSLVSFSPIGYHLVFPSLDYLEIEDCFRMITNFTIDSTLSVHAETKAPRLDDTSTRRSRRDICWRSDRPSTSLPPYLEEPN